METVLNKANFRCSIPWIERIRNFAACALIILAAQLFASLKLHAASQLDLEDVEIKGELFNSNRLQLLAREKNVLRDIVRYRTSYRSEIIQGLPKPRPRFKF